MIRALLMAIAFSVIVSGCIAEETTTGGFERQSNAAPEAAPPGEFDETTGAIAGIVFDSELQPISGVDIALFETEFITSSARDGTFTLSHVAPGDYVLLAATLGYEQRQTLVSVRAAEATPVKVALQELPVSEPRAVLYIFEGFITCTIGAAEVLSEECGQGLATDVGTFGANPNNKIDWKFNYTADQADLVGTLLELDWVPASAAADKLALHVANKFSCNPGCEADGPEYCNAFENFGPPPQRCYIDDLEMKEDEMPWEMTSRAWGAPVEATEVPNIVLEQKFTMYRTDFFGEMGAEDYSAIPDA